MSVNASCPLRYITYPSRSRHLGITYTDSLPNHVVMDGCERSDRLKLALSKAGITLRQAADRFGWNYNTLKSNANGNMLFSHKMAEGYASRLNVRTEWLYSGNGEMRELVNTKRYVAEEIPVIAWVQAGTLTDTNAIQTMPDVEYISVSGLGAGDWFATDVRGDSMDRISPEGSRIFVNSSDRDLIAGRFYLFSLRGEATYKRYYNDPVVRLEPFSTNPENRPISPTKDREWMVVGRVGRSSIDLK